MPQTFLAILKPGPGWIEGKPVTEQSLQAHGKYLLSIYKAGSLRFAGPFGDNAGGALVLEVADEGEAQSIITQDPAIVDQIFVYEMHPWNLVPWESYIKAS